MTYCTANSRWYDLLYCKQSLIWLIVLQTVADMTYCTANSRWYDLLYRKQSLIWLIVPQTVADMTYCTANSRWYDLLQTSDWARKQGQWRVNKFAPNKQRVTLTSLTFVSGFLLVSRWMLSFLWRSKLFLNYHKIRFFFNKLAMPCILVQLSIYLYTYKTLVVLLDCLKPCLWILDTEWLL